MARSEESDCPEIPKPEERLKILLGERPDPKPDAEIRKDFRPPFWAFTFRNLPDDADARSGLEQSC